jgi:hypothetical protein
MEEQFSATLGTPTGVLGRLRKKVTKRPIGRGHAHRAADFHNVRSNSRRKVGQFINSPGPETEVKKVNPKKIRRPS